MTLQVVFTPPVDVQRPLWPCRRRKLPSALLLLHSALIPARAPFPPLSLIFVLLAPTGSLSMRFSPVCRAK